MFLVYGALLGIIGTRNVLVITAIPALVMGTLLIRARIMDASPALFFLFLLTIMLRIASIMAVLNFLPTINEGIRINHGTTAGFDKTKLMSCYDEIKGLS